ncbi:type II toxin-antitoxin system RelE/ParE family toxin [Patescibacteria group bacterium]|nr:type II toxin-antitoxin system RelE/ParE family toxin [Patescibacteria group bacterium]MCG2694702.1 type II toxin-antitoxin system RelE/ParE family toxin [Candidatus Parcubacteria bacterium]
MEIIYEKKVVSEDIPKLSKTNKERIEKAIKEKLTTSPEFFGKPLSNSLKGFRKLRVGDYRIIFVIENEITVKIVCIDHRSVIYKNKTRFE